MSVISNGRYGLKKNVKTIVLCRIFALICILGSISVSFFPWLSCKVNKAETDRTLLELFGFDGWFNTLKSYAKNKTPKYTLFLVVLMISLVLYFIAVIAELAMSAMTFIKKKSAWTYQGFRIAAIAGLAATWLVILMILSLPNSKSKIFFQGMFSFTVFPFIPGLLQIFVGLIFSKKMSENAVAIGFYFPDEIPTMKEYSKILEDNAEDAAAIAALIAREEAEAQD